MTERVTWDGGDVSIAWHEPAGADTYVVLAHGAGGDMHTPQLRAVADGLSERGIAAVRFNFLYSERKKKAPDRTAILEDCYRAVAGVVRERGSRLFIGGRSMGGRIGSHIVAAGEPADGLVFLAYPLHPPGKQENLRDAHLYEITAPMLFIQGTRDPFAQRDLLEATVARTKDSTLHWIDGGDHSHKVAGRTAADVTAELIGVIAGWISRGA